MLTQVETVSLHLCDMDSMKVFLKFYLREMEVSPGRKLPLGVKFRQTTGLATKPQLWQGRVILGPPGGCPSDLSSCVS